MTAAGDLAAAVLSPAKRQLLERLRRGEAAAALIPRRPAAAAGTAPLSFAQERLWLAEQLAPGAAAYHMPAAVELSGPLAVEALGRALGAIVGRHEALRTRFTAEAGVPAQRIDPPRPVALPCIALAALPAGRRDAEWRRLAAGAARRPFALASGPLLRTWLVACAPERHVLICVFHHIVADGWSIGVFARELATLYGAFAEGRPDPLPPLPLQPADHAFWQRSELAGERRERLLAHWRACLAGAPEEIDLPADRPAAAPGGEAPAGYRESRPDPRLDAALARLCRSAGATPFMGLLAAFGALLGRVSGQQDLVVGSPVANRGRHELEGLIGCFVNTLALRLDLAGSPSFGELLARVRAATLDAYEHQDLPFEQLVAALRPERARERTPLFQVMLALQNAPLALRLPGLELALTELPRASAAFALTLAAGEAAGAPRWEWEYRRDRFDAATVERLAAQLQALLAAAVAAPERLIAELPLATAAERHQALHEWSGAAAPRPAAGPLLPALVAAQAARRPDRIAVVDAATGESLTYGELAAAAGRLAGALRRAGAGAEARVGIELPRSTLLVVAMLAVLEAGAAYVPLDPDLPAARREELARAAGLTLRLDREAAARLAAAADPHPGALPPPLPAAAAYVVFTSGSTGAPKGVAVSHAALAWYAGTGPGVYGFGADEVVLQLAALGFDTSVEEIFCTLAHGARLVLRDAAAAASVAALYRLAERHQLTSLHPPTALWHEMAAEPLAVPPAVRRVVIGGEAPLPDRVEAWQRRHRGRPRLFNSYGPTEATVVAAALELPAGGAGGAADVPLGCPVPGAEIYLLDEALQPVPPGMAGELYLGGPGVVRGYLGQAGETARRFLPHPFAAVPGERLYRTGDRARRRADGALIFRGRLDEQVKIRGFRVEPREAEMALAALPGVRAAAVVTRAGPGGAPLLVGYAVLAAPATAGELRAALAARLPDYLVPARLVVRDELPRLPSGKLDRRALAALPLAAEAAAAAGAAAGDAAEELLQEIWSEVLGLRPLPRDASFIELGGHSLLATQVVSRVRQAFGVELPVRELFEAPTVAGLARRLAGWRAGEAPPPPLGPRPRTPPPPLSFAQQRLWFLDQLAPGSAAYNLAAAVDIAGPLAAPALRRAIAALAARHESLRTRFVAADGVAVQVIDAAASTALPHVDLRALAPARREAERRRLAAAEGDRPFDLAAGPLLRTRLLELAPERHLLLCVMHHIVSDGWSLGIFTRELLALYAGAAGGRARPLAPLPVQYADFALWQREVAAGGRLERQIEFWRRALAGAPALVELATDRPRPPVASLRGGQLPCELPGDLVAALAALARRGGATLFMVTLAAFEVLLLRASGQEEVLVGSPVANRTLPETEGLIGFFVNTLVFRAGRERPATFCEHLAAVRDQVLDACAHQEVPFERVVEELAPRRSLAHSPLFQVMFALDNAPAPKLALPGLEMRLLPLPNPSAKFDLSLHLEPRADGFAGFAEYAADLFDPPTVARFVGHYRTLLGELAGDPEAVPWEVSLLSSAERAQALAGAAGPAPEAAPARGVDRLLALAAERAPDATAAGAGDRRLTHGELAARARALAWRLQRLGVGAETVVGLAAERGLDMLVGLAGILRAGGAYLPLDPALPHQRLRAMLEDGGARALLLGRRLAPLAAVAPAGCAVLPFGGDAAPGAAGRAEDAALPWAEPESLAYVLFTSGSTGRPKGVCVSHGALVNLLAAMRDEPGPGPGDVVLAVSTLSFDIASFELLAALAAGARVEIAPAAAAADGGALAALLAELRPSFLQATPATWRLLLEAGWRDAAGMRLLSGGEALPRDLADRLLGLPAAPAGLWNYYGPTEAAVYATGGRVPPGGAPVTIGRAIAGTAAHVLDRRGQPLPLGVAGEIHLGGRGLARGYAGAAAATAERFVPDPYGAAGGRLYRTGDLGRRRADGSLEFLGRLDQQVKIRGFRIELGEIEAALAALPGIAGAAAAVREDLPGERRIVAYVVPAAGAAPPGEAAVRRALAARLPDYMLPAALVPLAALPLTASGKLDRRALPAPAPPPPAAAERGRTPWEELVLGAFAEVLGRPELSREQDFFAAGGHSLLATRAASRLAAATGTAVPLRWLFEAPTAAALAVRLAAAAGSPALRLEPLAPAPRDGPLPLSFAQERLWFLERLEPGGSAYNLLETAAIAGPLDAAALALALADLERRQEALGTRIAVAAGEPRLAPRAGPGPPLAVVDLRQVPATAAGSECERLVRREARRRFDLERGPLARWLLVRRAAADHVFIASLHHLVADAWSLSVLAGDLAALYRARLARTPPLLPALPVQYADYAAWQRRTMTGAVLAGELAFWRERLAGAPASLELATDRPRPPVQGSRGAAVAVAIAPALTAGLERLARRCRATLFMTLAAGFAAVLARHSGQPELLLGTPVANRTRRESEGLIGLFVNTLVLRADLGGEPAVGELVGRLRERALEAYAHQELPFELLVEALAPARDLSRSVLFQALLALQNTPPPPLELGAARFSPLAGPPPEAVKFDLALSFTPAGPGLEGVLEYRTDLFDAATVRRLASHLEVLLAAACGDDAARVSELPLLAPAERAQLVREWNDTAAELAPDLCLDRLLAAQAARTPERTAVEQDGERLSYRELAARAEALAGRLAALGIGPERIAGICLERSPALVVAMLAVLAAGGAYLPLDPSYPDERLRFMLADCGAAALLTTAALAARLGYAGPVVALDDPAPAPPAAAHPARPTRPRRRALPGNLAYVLYTSGSTGVPKGAMIPHAAIVNHMLWMQRRYPLAPGDAVLQKTPVSFDASVWEFYAPLLAGARLVLAPPGAHRDPALLAAEVRRRAVTVLQVVPTLLELLVAEPGFAECRSLRRVYCGGEALTMALAARFFARLDAELVNVYGPTETTIHASSWASRAATLAGATAIGVPIANAVARVLDRLGAPLPIGVPGALHVGGANLGRGYHARPDWTAERFVPDPFAAAPGSRLYATGDLARLLPDGRLEFLGRADHQVKLRGVRIELGEIEAQLAAAGGVRQAAVALHAAAGEPELVAWVVPDSQAPPAAADLRQRLAAVLPAAAVPARFVFLERLPLLPNGKLDRRALPAPAAAPPTPAAADLPRTPLESLLRELWAEALERPDLGIHDGFFDAGGHSLLAIRLAARLRDLFGVEVPVLALFEAPTVAAFARRLEALRREATGASLPLVPRRHQGPAPLSSAQERLWFLAALQPGSAAYHLPLALELSGDLDAACLEAALAAIARRHEILRTVYRAPGGRPVQLVLPAPPRRLPRVDLAALGEGRGAAVAGRLAAAVTARPFDLAAGPVWRALLVRLAARRHLLVLVLHHIAADGWSTRLLAAELATLYEAAALGRPAALPRLPVQYADYALWQRQWLAGSDCARQLAYWRERLAGAPAVLALPADRPRPAVASGRGGELAAPLPAPLAAALRGLGRGRGTTLFMALLAGFQALLARLAGEPDVLVGTPVGGRGRTEIEGLIGLFANTLVLRAAVAPEASFAALLAATRAAALGAFAHQELPFDRLVEALAPQRDLAVAPIFQVFFSFQDLPPVRCAPSGLAVTPVDVAAGAARFDLAWEVTAVPGGLAARFEYGADLFDGSSIARLAGQLRTLLAAAAAAPELPLAALPLLGEGERHQLVVEWNDTAVPRADADAASIAEQLVRRAAAAPEREALVAGGEVVRYGELERRAARFARRLAAAGVGPESLVGLYLPRSPEMVVAMLGILAAGAAYLPLAPDQPPARLAAMLADSGARVLVAHQPLPAGLAAAGVAVVDPATAADGGVDGEPEPPDADVPPARRAAATPEALAYVIYTSGSTGRPKGVMVSQGAVLNFFRGMDERLGGGPGRTWLAATGVGFDISVLELLWALTRGCRVVLQREPQALAGAGARPAAGRATRPIDLGLFFFASEEQEGDPRKYRLLEAAARFADERGFCAVWTPERHFHAFGGLYPNPAVIGAALAAWTRRVEIRAGSVVLPLHHPLRVAEEWSVVDNLSGGRVAVSFASGWHPDDFVLQPGSYARRKELMFEGIETVRRLWRGEAVAGVGGNGAAVAVRVHPRPVQPELPVWVTAAGSPETFAMAGRIGAHLLTHLLGQDLAQLAANIATYRAAFRPAAGGPPAGRVSVMLHTFVGDDLEAVRERVRAPFTAYLRSSLGLLRGMAAELGQDLDAAAFGEDDMRALLEHAFARYFETSSLFGTPEVCAAMLARLAAAGADEIACLIDFGVDADAVVAALPALDEVRAAARRAAAAAEPSLADQVARHGVTDFQCTPSLAAMLLADPEATAALGSLDRLLVGGEPLPASLAARLAACGPREIHNLYGPTETTVWSTTRRLGPGGARPTAGRPIANTALRLLDGAGRLAPPGVVGEVAIAGAGLARGYLGRPDLSAERFVPDPWGGPGERLYRTGDLGRLTPAGELEILGRTDQQVKVRGVRVELGEIEAALCRHPAVREAVAQVREDAPGDRRLAAYWVAAAGAAVPDPAALRRFLAESLPDAMLPDALVRLDALPLTPNRKLDRRALPAPAAAAAAVPAAGAAPRTELEALVAGVWAATLKCEAVGIHDNFFAAGGHSLLATQLLVRLREATGKELPLRMVFEEPTVAGLAAAIAAAGDDEAGARPPLAPVPRRRLHPLSHAQQQLFVLHQLAPDSWAYNDHGAVALRGALDLAALRRSLAEIVRRHEGLRTRFVLADARAWQSVDPPAPPALPMVDLAALPPAARAARLAALVRAQARRLFDPATGPLLRLCLLRLAPAEHVVALAVHHIAWDGWSLAVFLREMTALYDAFSRGLPPPLAPLPIQVADFAEWQRAWLDEAAIERLLGFWRRELDGAPRLLRLPADRARPPQQSFRGSRHGFAVPVVLAAELRSLARREGATLFMTLLAGFEVLLWQRSGQEDFLIGTDVANRGSVETEALIGFFVNQLVLRSDVAGDPGFAVLLKRVRQRALAAFAHQDLPFDRLVSALEPDRDLGRTPLFQVKLVLQNVPREPLAMAGIELAPLELGWESAKFDLLVNLADTGAEIAGSLEYASDLFDEATAARLAAAYLGLLSAAAADPAQPLSRLAAGLALHDETARVAERGAREGRSRERLARRRPAPAPALAPAVAPPGATAAGAPAGEAAE